MENKKKFKELSYNFQIAVDHYSYIILANSVTHDCTDHHQLQPHVEQTEKNLGGLPEGTKFSADNGYHTGANLRYLEEKGLDGYIPNRKQAGEMKGKKKNKKYSKDKFQYDALKDQFTCPQGEILTQKGEYEYKGNLMYAYYGENCSACPYQLECAGKGRKKVITSNVYEGELQRMAAKMQTPEGKEEYKKRNKTVEWPFGNIKYNLKFTEFLVRGFGKAGTVQDLVSSAHNLKIIWKKISQNITSICKIISSTGKNQGFNTPARSI